MKEIALTRGLVALVDDEDYEKFSTVSWNASAYGYAVRMIRHPQLAGKWTSISLHRQIMGLSFGDGRQVDHINGNKLDNRKENLRICTNTQNAWNRGAQCNNRSGFKGVSWFKRDRKWVARIRVAGKYKHLGYYFTLEEAHEVYALWADMFRGSFARVA
ncbi:HNH endonuclease [Burkholderia multivorans]|uniref:HNH endonuclease n=1 Tax=Burkholderia multivorans TaxID=87883 RepID=UPI0021BE82BF|nr:HNH endonuclease [Burkholderia multivorans]